MKKQYWPLQVWPHFQFKVNFPTHKNGQQDKVPWETPPKK